MIKRNHLNFVFIHHNWLDAQHKIMCEREKYVKPNLIECRLFRPSLQDGNRKARESLYIISYS